MAMAFAFLLVSCTQITLPEPIPGRWSEKQAKAWNAAQPWPVGCVYMPSYAGTSVEPRKRAFRLKNGSSGRDDPPYTGL